MAEMFAAVTRVEDILVIVKALQITKDPLRHGLNGSREKGTGKKHKSM